MIEAVSRPKKRLFIVLAGASLLVVAFSLYGLWMVTFPGLSEISEYLPLIVGLLAISAVAAIAFGIAGIVMAIMGLNNLGIFQGPAWIAINLLFPSATRLGKVFDIDKECIERSFIEVSNHLIRQKHIKVKSSKLLTIAPHCIQHEACPHKITRDVSNCRKCGACQVGELLSIVEKYQVNLAIVTGGTLARKVLKTLRPQVVVAIACERDLTSGIQDAFPLPVIGILNERPFGPCCNTRVSVEQVELTVENFLD